MWDYSKKTGEFICRYSTHERRCMVIYVASVMRIERGIRRL
jgi:hypothetical protein